MPAELELGQPEDIVNVEGGAVAVTVAHFRRHWRILA